MKSFRIGRELEYITITLPDRDPESSEQLANYDFNGANWISAHIKIAVGGFDGSYRATLERTDFPHFRDALKKLYSFESSRGEFSTIENQLHIVIRGDRRGNFEAICVARDTSDGNCLEFKLAFDQTEIPPMLKQLDAIIEAYPVLGKRPNAEEFVLNREKITRAPTHPGVLFARDMLPELDRHTIEEIATLLQVSRQTLDAMMAGQTAISPEMAVRLGKLCGNGPELWLNLQARYDAWEATRRLGKEIDSIPTLTR
jgi:addiction module HigA family antidote